MDYNDSLRQFNDATKSYFISRQLENERQIERSLQVLAASADVSVFDPGQKDAVQFFVNLHEVMNGLDPSSSLAWTAIASLKEVCRNSSARFALIHTYKFIPILTRFLFSEPTSDQECQLLRLIEELTYGIKVSWQEAHLPRLILSLTKLITSDATKEKVALSLSILVNLCYKNLPAVYSLMRTIDVKKFLKSVLTLQHHDESTKIQVCKLMIILKSVTGELPDLNVNIYLKSVCPTLMTALNDGNTCLMRQTVSFYKEVTDSCNESRSYLQKIDRMSEEISTLIQAFSANRELNPDCVDILFEYLHEIVRQGCWNVEELYPTFLNLAFSWISNDKVSTNALQLVSCIMDQVTNLSDEDLGNKEELSSQLFAVIDQQLLVVLLLLDVDKLNQSDESYQRLSALLHLLSKMVNISKFTNKILQSLDPQKFRTLFDQVKLPNQQNSLFQSPIYTFYIKALMFLQELADKEPSWLILYNDLLLEKQTQYVLSIALYAGSQDIKMSVLKLTTTPGFSLECLKVLSSCLFELNNLFIFSPSGCKKNENSSSEMTVYSMDVTPPITITQEGQLNRLLHKFELDNDKNKKSETSAIMELYQFRVASMSQTIRYMQSSQEAADNRATKLQHNLAMTTSECFRLHQLLYSTQQSVEAANKENVKLSSQIEEMRLKASDLHAKHSEAIQNLRSKTIIISELNAKLEKANDDIADATKTKAALTNENENLQTELQSVNQSLEDCKKELNNHKKELSLVNQKLELLKKDYLNQSVEFSKLEKAKAESDSEAAELNKQLNIISQLAMKRKLDK